MLYKINLLDFSWHIVGVNLLILFLIIKFVSSNELLSKKQKLKLLIPFSLFWSGVPLYQFFSHFYVNYAYHNHSYDSVSGEVISVIEKDRYVTITGFGYRVRYSTVGAKCLTRKLKINKGEIIKVDFLFDKQNACIVQVTKS